jgi:activator of HSP90 ATPase
MADAAKLDNWHWTEKDISQWSKDKISELLTDFQIEDDQCLHLLIYLYLKKLIILFFLY